MVHAHDAIDPVAQDPRVKQMSTFRLAGFAGLLVVAALVGGTIIGSVAAATAPPTTQSDPIAAAPSAGARVGAARAAEYCADFRRAFAAGLGVPESALAPAAKQAAISTIDAAVAAGEMTKVAGDRLRARIEQAGADGCALLAGRLGAGRVAARPAVGVVKDGLGAAASALGIGPAELGAQLRGGKTLKEIAAARAVPYETVSAAVVASVKSDLDTAVAGGKIRQVRADRILKRLQANLADGRLRNVRRAAPIGPVGSAAPAAGG